MLKYFEAIASKRSRSTENLYFPHIVSSPAALNAGHRSVRTARAHLDVLNVPDNLNNVCLLTACSLSPFEIDDNSLA
ncbi:hypothetical protein EVAR_51530_1 [Eumeta japonica]|uniref:Uncharacterized protein n=1 Tax=Eumeta variegata TaxID=151549 RepID=A0A4C1XFD3_EUMVA|nr:hypothetical protein EVAR_51530_1 [Eumeta japonica]